MTLTTMIIGILIYLLVTPIINFLFVASAIVIGLILAIVIIWTVIEKVKDLLDWIF